MKKDDAKALNMQPLQALSTRYETCILKYSKFNLQHSSTHAVNDSTAEYTLRIRLCVRVMHVITMIPRVCMLGGRATTWDGPVWRLSLSRARARALSNDQFRPS